MREGVMGFIGIKPKEEEDTSTYYGSKMSKAQKERAVEYGNTLDVTGRKLFKRLIMKGVFDTIPFGDEQAVSRHNEAVALLAELGIFEKSNIDKIVDSLINLRYKGDAS